MGPSLWPPPSPRAGDGRVPDVLTVWLDEQAAQPRPGSKGTQGLPGRGRGYRCSRGHIVGRPAGCKPACSAAGRIEPDHASAPIRPIVQSCNRKSDPRRRVEEG
jgi:hypothetical protein